MKNLRSHHSWSILHPNQKSINKNLQIMMKPENFESAVKKDILILAGAAIVLFIIFSFLALTEFQESLK